MELVRSFEKESRCFSTCEKIKHRKIPPTPPTHTYHFPELMGAVGLGDDGPLWRRRLGDRIWGL